MVYETIKGFRDFTGEEAKKRAEIKKILVNIFESYGFEPAECPIIENIEFVKGENANDEAVSDIFKLSDKGGRALALRYEHTFQLKRIMKNKKLPYKRYQIGEVFRDEPVSTNRFRQFTQCDIDIVGSTIKEEAEILAIIKEVMQKLGIKYRILINNRKLMNEILEKENIDKIDRDKIIKIIDKLDKIGEEEVYNQLRGLGAWNLLEIFKNKENFFEKYSSYEEIKELKKFCKFYGVDFEFSPTLARGLSYYNGAVFEVKAEDNKIKETITAGGSYMFDNVQCTGVSFGLDRLAAVSKVETKKNSFLVISLNKDKEAIEIAQNLRKNGNKVTILYGKPSKALDYANAYNIQYAIFVGEDEIKNKKFKIKNLETGKEKKVSKKELTSFR